jgi:hypothetical protein
VQFHQHGYRYLVPPRRVHVSRALGEVNFHLAGERIAHYPPLVLVLEERYDVLLRPVPP